MYNCIFKIFYLFIYLFIKIKKTKDSKFKDNIKPYNMCIAFSTFLRHVI